MSTQLELLSEEAKAWALINRLAALFAPPELLTVSQWSDQNRRTSSKSSAQAGEWVTRPYQREPMDAFTDPRIHTIGLMVARQTLKTEVINNCIGYVIDKDPGPILVVQYRDTDCQRYSKIRLMPMLRETPVLAAKVADVKSRASSNTIDYKDFAGGHLSIVASGSPGNLAALPIRYLFCDEIDKYPASAGSAGDPIALASGRQEEFWNRKTVLACTPTFSGSSRIERVWNESDQREYQFRCPYCDEYQTPNWRTQVRWDDKLPRHEQAASARYHCRDCNAAWNDPDRWNASARGRYRATAPFNGIAGFRVSGLCRQGSKLRDMVEEFLQACHNPEALKTFINEQLAEVWTVPGEAPDWEIFRSRAEDYARGSAPAGVLCITAGVDVQKDRIETAIWGWGRGKQRWLIDYQIDFGDTSKVDSEPWAALTAILNQTWRHESGAELSLLRLGIDSGHQTTVVYDWARQQAPGRVVVIKGFDTGHGIIANPKTTDRVAVRKRRGVLIYPVNVSLCKSELYGQLRLQKPAAGEPFPPGWVHTYEAGDDFYRQMTAEKYVETKNKRGYIQGTWQLAGRNEALDCANYARAAAEHAGLSKWNDAYWRKLEDSLAITPGEEHPPDKAAPATPAPAKPITPSQPEAKPKTSGSWLHGGGNSWLNR